jgi:hypothetical protein
VQKSSKSSIIGPSPGSVWRFHCLTQTLLGDILFVQVELA